MIEGNGIRYILEEDCFTCFWLGHNEPPLPFADGREQIHNAHREVLGAMGQAKLLVGKQRGQIIEGNTVPDLGRAQAVDALHSGEDIILLTFPRWPNLGPYGIARFEAETFDHVPGHIDIIGGIEVMVIGRPQVAKAIRGRLQDAFDLNHRFEGVAIRRLGITLLPFSVTVRLGISSILRTSLTGLISWRCTGSEITPLFVSRITSVTSPETLLVCKSLPFGR